MEQRKNWMTIPNFISIVRLLLIPVFVVTYFWSFEDHYIYAILIVGFSGLTDIVDGVIARRFNMISDLGKILDPAADKLTQATVLICLSISHPRLIPVVLLLFAKEICQLIGAVLLLKKSNVKQPPAARWWGKASTVILFLTMMLTVLTDIYPAFPDAVSIFMIVLSCVALIFSFGGYYLKIYRELKK